MYGWVALDPEPRIVFAPAVAGAAKTVVMAAAIATSLSTLMGVVGPFESGHHCPGGGWRSARLNVPRSP